MGKSMDEKRAKPAQAFVAGFLMGTADSIPGISASTVALVIGWYERFIDGLHRAISLPLKWKEDKLLARQECNYLAAVLIPLFIGIFSALFIVSRILIGPDNAPGIMRRVDTAAYAYAVIFGIVIASIRAPWGKIKNPTITHWVLAAVGTALMIIVTGLPFLEREPPLWAIPFGAMIAISAMLLPGISGSMVLVVIGHYTIVASSVHDLDLAVIILFGTGMAVGAITAVPIIARLMEHHLEGTMAVLTGFILGSLRPIWPWKSNYNHDIGAVQNTGIESNWPLILIFIAIGMSIILALSRLQKHLHPPHFSEAE